MLEGQQTPGATKTPDLARVFSTETAPLLWAQFLQIIFLTLTSTLHPTLR